MNALPAALAVLVLSAFAPVADAERAGASPPPAPMALTAAPSRLQLAPGASATVQVTNPGRAALVVSAVAAGYAIDARGRPRVAPGSARVRLAASPNRLVLAPAGRAALTLSVRVTRGTAPGDHTALLLLATEPSRSGGLPARIRVGVVVVVRVPGVVVRRLVLRGVALRRAGRARLLDVAIADRGNVDEWVGPRRLSITLIRGGRVVARVRPAARRFLARTSGVAEARAPGSLHGAVRAVVHLARPRPGVAEVRRSYPLRL
jgi:hypothetical protein